MIDLKDPDYLPDLKEISDYIKNELFDKFCTQLIDIYQVKPKIEFSKCSFEYGWNLKFKKAGKTLCVVYIRERYFTVLVVIGKKEKKIVENNLKKYCCTLQNIYTQTKEGNGQRWLMIDTKDEDLVYHDLLTLIEIRYACKFKENIKTT